MALQIVGRPCNGFIEVWLLHNDNESASASGSSPVILVVGLDISYVSLETEVSRGLIPETRQTK